MVETVRDKAAFMTLYADNSSNDIDEQDLRDFVETMHPPHGSLYISSSAETTISTVSTWTKAAGTTATVNLRSFDDDSGTNNRLRYTGTPDIHVHGVVSFTSQVATANKTLEYGAYHYDDSGASGAVLTHSIMGRRHATTDIGTGAIHFDVVLETNDYIELHIQNTTDNTNATVTYAYLFMLGMFM